MAKTVYILGAGASRAAGAPLMDDFLDKAEDLRSAPGTTVSKRYFDMVFELIQERLPRLHAKTVVNLTNIESVFSLLEMARLVKRMPDTTPEQIEELSVAMRTVLAETVQNSCRFDCSEGWRAPAPIRALAEFCERHRGAEPKAIAVLTFNWDLTMDLALHKAGVTIDYGFGEGVPSGAIPLLKLHGSLNWGSCKQCSAILPVPMAEVLRKAAIINGERTAPLQMRKALREIPQHCHEKPIDEVPAIVPPTWNKTQYHLAFASIWQRAAEELSEASDVTVIGYSLPQSDAFFRDLLALSLASRTRVRRFTVVDPEAQAAERFKNLIGPDLKRAFHHHEGTFESFADQQLGKQVGVTW